MIRKAGAGAALAALAAGASLAGDPDGRTIVREALPASAAQSTANIHRVSAARTPSGFAVPRFVSLKLGKVNARTGPSLDHSIAYQYQRRGLPLVVVAETEMWRKVRDVSGDEAWVRKPALSGKRRAITLDETTVFAKADRDARAVARVERGAVVELGECGVRFCRVETPGGLKGHAERYQLWGAQRLD